MLSGAGAERETNKEVALLRSKSSFFFFSKMRTFYFLTVTDSTALRINTARCIMVTTWQARRFYTYQSCSEWCHARKKEEEEKKRRSLSVQDLRILNSGSYQLIGRKWEHFLFVTAWWTQVLRNNRAGFRSVHVWWHPCNFQSGPDFLFFFLCSFVFTVKIKPWANSQWICS